MMGVYIKGMEMPFTCLSCEFHKCAAGVGDFCSLTKRRQFRFKNRPKDCPLIEVPESHGRLIDADALVEDMKRQCEEVFKIDAVSPDDFWITRDQAYNERLWKTWCESFFEYLKTRETIIPESEEG